ncbi:hypothetical protein LCGC14_1735270 [marine sediment metagenome]|uniref:Toprim domain-containing protein n=1 Tax=marine sediment metagenome TaxID=412755 RepID=A0A0F9HVZ4_9ZZZZ
MTSIDWEGAWKQWKGGVVDALDKASPSNKGIHKHRRCPNPDHADWHPSFRITEQGAPICSCGTVSWDELAAWCGVTAWETYKVTLIATDDNPQTDFHKIANHIALEGLQSVPDEACRKHLADHRSLPDFSFARCEEWTEKLARNQSVLEWLDKRGVTMWREYRLGWTGDDKQVEPWFRNRITIPHLYRGRVWGIKLRRNPFSEQGLKYISFTGSRYHVAFNADFLLTPQEHLIMVETELDAAAVQSVSGLPALAIPAGVTEIGAAMMLVGLAMCRFITLIPDNDDPGRGWATVLRSVIPRVHVHWLADFHHDIGEYIQDWRAIPDEITKTP